MDRCPHEDRLLDLGEGRVSGPEADTLGAHLATCEGCRSTMAELMALRADAVRDRPEPGARAEAAVFEAIRLANRALADRRSGAGLLGRAAAAALLVAGAAALIGVGARSLKARTIVATVTSADARVVVRRDGDDRPAVAGMGLREGDELAVPADATAVLELPDRSRAELGPESTLILHDPGVDAPLELRVGFLAVDAARRSAGRPLAVRTPDARAEVLGTRFTLGADAAETHLRVAEGLVHLVRTEDGASVDVTGGNRSEVVDADRAGLRSRPTLPGTILIIASYDKAPPDFARFNAMIGERLLGRRLRHLGFRVETKAHADVTEKDLVGRPLVIVSYSEEGVGFEESLGRIGLKDSGVPVLCFEPAAFPALAFTGPSRGRDYDWQGGGTAVEFPDPDHPLSGGLGGLRRDLFARPGCFGWARPGGSARTIAAVAGDGSKAVMFGYEAGAEMVGIKALGRKVGLFLDPSQVGEDSEPAWSLVEAAVQWCVEPPRGGPAGGAR